MQVSVIILNYNGRPWLERCVGSLRQQTIAGQMEVIVADNLSPDGSADLAARLMAEVPGWKFVQHGANLGFCEGNNRAVPHASGRYLLFLNNDTWLEPDCLEVLLREVEAAGAVGGAPLILNYTDDSVQTWGASGFDFCGFFSPAGASASTSPRMAWSGCAYLIRRDVFEALGGFDAEMFMYADEWDLSWRLWAAGHRGVVVPQARLHHRSEANINPEGGGKMESHVTSIRKRFFANRNNLVVVLKNTQHVLLLLAVVQFLYLVFEGLLWSLIARRGSLFTQGYVAAFADCWRLRGHILRERRKLGALRQRSDWWMLRFFRLTPNRWIDVQRLLKYGPPVVAATKPS